jgi:hypothetical protein
MKLKNHYSISVVFSFIVLFFLSGSTLFNAEQNNHTSTEVMQQGKLRHVVLFKFKEGTTQSDIRKVEEAFKALPAKIPQIKDFEWGTNNSPEGLDKGFTHCFFLTFNSEADRAIYLPHPEHKAFGAVLGPYLEDVLVVDYWVKE